MGYRKAILKRLDQVRRQYFRDEPASVARAAKYLNLDPANAHDREKLLRILAEAIFVPAKKGRRAGVRPYWHNGRLIHLGSLYDTEKHENPKLKDAQIAGKYASIRTSKTTTPIRYGCGYLGHTNYFKNGGLTSRQPLRPSMRPNMASQTSSKSRRNMIFNWVSFKGTD